MRYLLITLLALMTLPSFAQEAKVYDYVSIVLTPVNNNLMISYPDKTYVEERIKAKSGDNTPALEKVNALEKQGYELFAFQTSGTGVPYYTYLLRKPRE